MSMKQAAALMTPSTPARTSQGGSGWSATGRKVGTRLERTVPKAYGSIAGTSMSTVLNILSKGMLSILSKDARH